MDNKSTETGRALPC